MLVEEAIVVANACGCTLEHDAELEHAFEVARMTDETISSMVQDVTHHKETEIRIITGAVCRLGREHHVPTPATICFCSWFWPSSPSIWAAEQSRRGALEASGGKYLAVWRLFHVPYGSSFLTQSAFCTMLYIVAYKERSKLP